MPFECHCTARQSVLSTSSLSADDLRAECEGSGAVVRRGGSPSTSDVNAHKRSNGTAKTLDARSDAKTVKDVPLKGIVNVRLKRTPGVQLGLGIAGGSDRTFPPTISFLRPGFIAHRCDQLQIGERLTHVNGIAVSNLAHEEVLAVLRNAGSEIYLQVEYDLNEPSYTRPRNMMSKCTDIVLEKEGGSFGLTLRGGAYGPDRSKSRPITITNIRTGGPAHREGRLRVGDRVLCINGVDVFSATLAVAHRLLEESLHSATLTIEYDVSVLESVTKAVGPLMLEIDKTPGTDLGISLRVRNADKSVNSPRAVLIESVTPASTADRCGALHVSDEIISVDGIGLKYTTLAEAKQLLKGHASTIRIEILPLSQFRERDAEMHAGKPLQERSGVGNGLSRKEVTDAAVGTPTSPNTTDVGIGNGVRRRYSQQPRAKSHERALMVPNGLSVARESARRVNSQQQQQHPQITANRASIGGSVPNVHSALQKATSSAAPAQAMSRSFCKFLASDLHNGNGSVHGSVATAPSGNVCHTETMEVVLHSYAKGGFGLVLHRQQSPSGESASSHSLFISYIEKGSPSERSGVLQVGDRVLTINDWCTAKGTVEEANRLLRQAGSPLTLTVEFDVVESVLPSNGILNVKLAKRGNNLGIIARSETDGKKGEPVIISDIRTGSVAHRCGSIQVGDRILAIDNIPLDSCTVEEAMRLLQRSGDVVKLRIRKANTASQEESDAAHTVVYSIELNRRGRPLGITIASRGEKGDPVIISQLAPNGLAERTGALRVGDRILAINGECIEGKKVADAMHILQQSSELVTIKISRFVEPAVSFPSHSFAQGGNLVNNHRYRLPHAAAPSDSFSEASEKLGTPIQSIDSAVESLEDSPVGQQRTQSATQRFGIDEHPGEDRVDWRAPRDTANNNTSNRSVATAQPVTITNVPPGPAASQPMDQCGWDSGLSSTTDNGAFECCACQKASTSDTDDWVKILEALETVGEAEMLKKLEESIMGGTVPMCSHVHNSSSSHAGTSIVQPSNNVLSPSNAPLLARQQWQSFAPSATNTILRQPPTAANASPRKNEKSYSERVDSLSLHSADSLTGALGYDIPPCMPPPKPPRYDHPDSTRLSSLFTQLANSDAAIPYITSPVPSHARQNKIAKQTASPSTSALVLHDLNAKSGMPSEKLKGTIHRARLHKDPATGSFGFSVSDGTGDNPGVFINAILPGGPASQSGQIFPLDRILQVNDTSLQYLDCDLAVPLLSANSIDLVLYRDPALRSIHEEDEASSCVGSVNLSLRDSAV